MTTTSSALHSLGGAADDGEVVGGVETPGKPTTSPVVVEFVVHGTPKPKGSLRHVGRGRLIEQVAGSSDWKDLVRTYAVIAMDGKTPLSGPVGVEAMVSLVRPKSHRLNSQPVTRSSGDVDKHARNLLDAISGVVIGDDSQVVHLNIRKSYGYPPAQPYVWMRVKSDT